MKEASRTLSAPSGDHVETIINVSMKLSVSSAKFVMETPSVAKRLEEDFIKIANAKDFFAISENNTDAEDEAKRFMKVFGSQWALRLAKTGTAVAEEIRFNREEQLPEPQNIEMLPRFVKEQLSQLRVNFDQPTWAQYKTAVELEEVRLTTYNRRRPGEIECIL